MRRLLPRPPALEIAPELRHAILVRVLVLTLAIAGSYALVALTGLARSRIFPVDLIWLLISVASGWALLRAGRTGQAAAFYISFVSQPFFYASQAYGIDSIVNAPMALGILLAGLLIGGWFLGLWVLLYSGWMLVAGIGQLRGLWGDPGTIATTGDLVAVVTFWWGLFALTGWLTRLFARNFEREAIGWRGQSATLARALGALATEPEAELLLAQTLAAIAEYAGVDRATLWLVDPEEGTVRPRLGYDDGESILPADRPDAFPPNMKVRESPLWQELLDRRAPLLVENVANDARLRLRSQLIAEGIDQVVYLPLLLGERLLGAVALLIRGRARPGPDELELAQALAHQLTLALRLTQLTEQAREHAVAGERNRMAREIHDTLAQGFTGIIVQLEAAEDALTGDPAAARDHLGRARSLARVSLVEARRSVRALRPIELERAPLGEALARVARRLLDGSGVELDLQIEPGPAPLGDEVEAALLRIAQEAITNALRHGRPTRLGLHLAIEGEELRLAIHDDGRGFDPAAPGGGFGLQSIRERAAMIGARLELTSHLGAGTTVSVRLAPTTVEPARARSRAS